MEANNQHINGNGNTNGNQGNRNWNILNWNIRGLNADEKQRAVRAKIDESGSAIYCLQETKMQSIDHSKIRK